MNDKYPVTECVTFLEGRLESDLWGFMALDWYYRQRDEDRHLGPSAFVADLLDGLDLSRVDPVAFHSVLLCVCVQLLGSDFDETIAKSIRMIEKLGERARSDDLVEIEGQYATYGKEGQFHEALARSGITTAHADNAAGQAEASADHDEEARMAGRHVFLAYCRENRDEVARLRSDLIAAGETVWWDEDIPVGQDWKYAAGQAMKDAYAVVLCLSTELGERVRSGIYPEIRNAIAILREYPPESIFILPVRLSECDIPDLSIDETRTLADLNYVDLYPEGRRPARLRRLLAALVGTPRHP